MKSRWDVKRLYWSEDFQQFPSVRSRLDVKKIQQSVIVERGLTVQDLVCTTCCISFTRFRFKLLWKSWLIKSSWNGLTLPKLFQPRNLINHFGDLVWPSEEETFCRKEIPYQVSFVIPAFCTLFGVSRVVWGTYFRSLVPGGLQLLL